MKSLYVLHILGFDLSVPRAMHTYGCLKGSVCRSYMPIKHVGRILYDNRAMKVGRPQPEVGRL